MTAVDSACPHPVQVLARARARTRSLAPAWWLGGIFVLSSVARVLLGLLRSTPNYFPDEYLYSELGRSLAESGRPLVRGAAAHFPALLQPLLTAPAWLVDDQLLAYRLAQAVDVVAMSLAAVPVYVLARQLRLGTRMALVLAAVAVAVPDMLYASSILSEPVAYPLVLAAVAAAVAALDRPSLRRHVLLIGLMGLATFARVQFAVLPACFVVAALATGLRTRSLRSVLRSQRLPLGLFSLLLVAGLAVGLTRNFGYYPSFVHMDAGAADGLHAAGANLLVLLYASGWVLVPGALFGAALALGRPRSRAEIAFASFTLVLAAALLAQSSLYGDTGIVQERYLFYVVPLFAVAFALYATRGWPHRLAYLGASAALAAVAALVPLTGYAATASLTQSLFLSGVYRFGEVVGNPGTGGALIAATASLASLLVALATLRPRIATPLALALALGAFGAATVAEVSFDHRTTAAVRARFLPEDRSWVDHADIGRPTLLVAPGRLRTDTLDQLFWNRSIKRVALLPGAAGPDTFPAEATGVRDDGTVVTSTGPLRGPVLLDEYATTLRLRDGRIVRRSATKLLWQPNGPVRLKLLALARYHDGWLGGAGTVMVWPGAGHRSAGWLTFRVTAAPGVARSTLTLHSKSGSRLEAIHLAGGSSRLVRVAVCAEGPWQLFFIGAPVGSVEGRIVSPLRATMPVLHPDPRACAGSATA